MKYAILLLCVFICLADEILLDYSEGSGNNFIPNGFICTSLSTDTGPFAMPWLTSYVELYMYGIEDGSHQVRFGIYTGDEYPEFGGTIPPFVTAEFDASRHKLTVPFSAYITDPYTTYWMVYWVPGSPTYVSNGDIGSKPYSTIYGDWLYPEQMWETFPQKFILYGPGTSLEHSSWGAIKASF